MSHIQYTISRSGTYYYNRRVPKHAVGAYGSHIRQALSKCSVEAAELSQRLSKVLESSWNNKAEILPVNIEQVVESFKPKSYLLSEVTEEYLSLRHIDEVPQELQSIPSYHLEEIETLLTIQEKMQSSLFITSH